MLQKSRSLKTIGNQIEIFVTEMRIKILPLKNCANKVKQRRRKVKKPV